MSDYGVLESLNQKYIEAFMTADVEWYEHHLADDFICIESDGSILNKAEFLKNSAKGPDVMEYKLAKVDVRVYGDAGLVNGKGLFTRRDGSSGVSRYTDVYVRTKDGWKVISAQVTRTNDSQN